jgi:hypothetical protein
MSYLENITEILKQEGFCLSGLDSANNPIDTQELISAFTAFECGENQQRLVVQIGQSRDFRFFDFLEYCIFNAVNENTRHGTLKYLHYYKRERSLLYIFEKIEEHGLRQAYEPYFSVAVDMIGGECRAKFFIS